MGRKIPIKKTKKKAGRDSCKVTTMEQEKYIFQFGLLGNHILCHNLDVIHVEKKVIDNVYGTVLNMNKNTKDNMKACLNLKDMGLKCELHPQMTSSNKIYLPPACFSMAPKEKDDFLKVLKGGKSAR